MRYFVGFLVSIGLLLLLVIMLLTGGNDKAKVPETKKTLNSYASTSAAVSMLIDGRTNAESIHRQIRVTVDRDNVTYEELQGYDGNVVQTAVFANTQTAYQNFLFALGRAGFTQGSTAKALQEERGFCPLGNRFVFELNQDNRQISRFWATSCSGTPKSYAGNLNLTTELFKAQVPNYSILRQQVVL